MPFDFQPLKIPEVILITAKTFSDERGFFMETYKQSEFARNGIPWTFVQDNYSHSSRRGVLRGLHYQLDPKSQGKLVLPVSGEILDVAVDVRRGSPTYGQWVAEVLSADARNMLYVPEGFAHGFMVLSEQADVTYRVTHEYAPEADRGIIWNDPDLAIDWPIDQPLLSPKDQALPAFRDAENNFGYAG
jgi:dTDP-4-dehydrorhamnose 3,5-epimerase